MTTMPTMASNNGIALFCPYMVFVSRADPWPGLSMAVLNCAGRFFTGALVQESGQRLLFWFARVGVEPKTETSDP